MWSNFREKAQYYYENATTGEIKWEYPLEEDKEEEKPKDTQENDIIDDDAMDICTTPPPNEHEDLSTAYYQSSGILYLCSEEYLYKYYFIFLSFLPSFQIKMQTTLLRHPN